MTLDDLHEELARHLDEIADCYSKPVKLAVLIRAPGNDEGDVFFGDLSLDDAEKLIERSRAREEKVRGG